MAGCGEQTHAFDASDGTFDTRAPCNLCQKCLDLASERVIHGFGWVRLRGVLSGDEVAAVMSRLASLKSVAGENGPGHRRVWNLLDKGREFETIAENDAIVAVVRSILGPDVAMGCLSSNTIDSGSSVGHWHVDYPYTSITRFPRDLLAVQLAIPLDPFTKVSGATQVVRGSQRRNTVPTDPLRPADLDLVDHLNGDPGDVLLWSSLAWHRSGENTSNEVRRSILAQYLPRYVKPMEDQLNGVRESVHRRASETMRQLLCHDHAYPVNERATGRKKRRRV